MIREEIGEMTNAGTADQSYVVKGRTVNFFPDGSLQIVEYVADKYGYRPKITFLTPQQLRKIYLGGDQSTHKPVPGVPTVPQGFSTQLGADKSSLKTEDTAKPNLTESNVGPVEQNVVRVPPQYVSVTSKTNVPFGNSPVSLDTYDEDDDIHNRIGANTAAALLGQIG